MSGTAGKDPKKARDAIKKVSRTIDDVSKQLSELAKLKGKLDNVSDDEALRLQEYMDKMSKAMEAVSNMMKKNQSTQTAILKNLK